ncbi:CPBP family intramembrane glutamic endopeptidase [Corynebacterium bovis]|uniref:CPBP family intramembrane metalloprotease n=1 Tax=Corynebacterium bovis TaxID=36808 RepID=A0A426PYM2_9CORY|nr:CPBP family intramembrane glutamic endopeptidase [Corynebacterium bovis]RRO86773.1 CPBP family intramembrane metalloprotease [Corynebacterium bovis]
MALRWEIVVVLVVTFGTSGVRAVLRLIDALARPERLSGQTVTLNAAQSAVRWLDPAFQLVSSAVLVAWAGLAVLLLLRHCPPATLHPAGPVRSPGSSPDPRPAPGDSGDDAPLRLRPSRRDILPGVGLAALIGLPGLALYLGAVALGLSRHVAAGGTGDWWSVPTLVVGAWANGVGEEVVVVAWLATRLRQLRVPWAWIFVGSAVLRGSYHLYQGYSAGVGNIVMGLVFVWWFRRTGRVWPLIVAHGLIDTVAFVGAVALPGLG